MVSAKQSSYTEAQLAEAGPGDYKGREGCSVAGRHRLGV